MILDQIRELLANVKPDECVPQQIFIRPLENGGFQLAHVPSDWDDRNWDFSVSQPLPCETVINPQRKENYDIRPN
jgi:hypothetical protein